MTAHFSLNLLAVALLVGCAIALCQWAHYRLGPRCRIASGDGHRVRNRYRNIAINVGTALAAYGVGVTLFGDHLIDTGRPSRWWTPVAVLLAYAAGYYWVHRALHWRPLMRRIHWVHHRMVHPTAVDALYLHPIETAMGLTVQLGSVAIVGPLGLGSFLAVSLAHALINVLDHANLCLASRLAWLSNHWAARHDLHHSRGGNYGSITPLWDWMFKTRSAS